MITICAVSNKTTVLYVTCMCVCMRVGAVAQWLERQTVKREDSGSSPYTVLPFRNLSNFVHPTTCVFQMKH